MPWTGRGRLAEGEAKEAELVKVFRQHGCEAHIANQSAGRDIEARVADHWHIIEVKNEDQYAKSGNICIELYQGKLRKVPSGLLVSDANIWIHTLAEKVVLYSAWRMRELLRFRLRKSHGPLLVPPVSLKEVRPFAGADNGNEGVILNVADVSIQSWGDMMVFDEFPKSVVFRVNR